MASWGWGLPTPSRAYPPAVSEGDVRGRGFADRIRSIFKRRDGQRTAKRRPDQMDIRRADGMYEVVPNRDAPMEVDLPSDEMAIYLDETYGPALDPDNENQLFAIAGFLTDDPEQVDRYGAEYPSMFLEGTPDHRREYIRRMRRESKGVNFEEDIRNKPYKYSMLNGERPLELRYRLNEVNERLGGMYVAKVVKKVRYPRIGEYVIDDYGNKVLNEAYPDSHDMYGAVLHDLLEDIQNQFPDTMFTLYLDPSSFMDEARLRMVCADFSTIKIGKVDSRKKNGGLRYADMIVGSSVESHKNRPENDFATAIISEHVLNRNRKQFPEEGYIILSFVQTE